MGHDGQGANQQRGQVANSNLQKTICKKLLCKMCVRYIGKGHMNTTVTVFVVTLVSLFSLAVGRRMIRRLPLNYRLIALILFSSYSVASAITIGFNLLRFIIDGNISPEVAVESFFQVTFLGFLLLFALGLYAFYKKAWGNA